MNPPPATPAAPLEVSSMIGEQAELLADRQVGVGGLGDEHGGQRQVDRGTVEVEAVAGGDDQADESPSDAGELQLAHQAGQGRLGGGGADDRAAAPP